MSHYARERRPAVIPNREQPDSPWLVAREAAARARCGPKVIYRAVRSGKLRAAQIGGRRELRFLPEWIERVDLGADDAGDDRRAC